MSSAFPVTPPDMQNTGTKASAAARLLAQGVKALAAPSQAALLRGFDGPSSSTITPPRAAGNGPGNATSPATQVASLLHGLKPFLASPLTSASHAPHHVRVDVSQGLQAHAPGPLAGQAPQPSGHDGPQSVQYMGQGALPHLVPPPVLPHHRSPHTSPGNAAGSGHLLSAGASYQHQQAQLRQGGYYSGQAAGAQWSNSGTAYVHASQPQAARGSPGQGLGQQPRMYGSVQGPGQGVSPGSQRSAGHKRDRVGYTVSPTQQSLYRGASYQTTHGRGSHSTQASIAHDGAHRLQYVSRHPIMPVSSSIHRSAADLRLRYPRLALPASLSSAVCSWPQTCLTSATAVGHTAHDASVWPTWLLQGATCSKAGQDTKVVDVVIDDDRKGAPVAADSAPGSSSAAHAPALASVCKFVDTDTRQEYKARFTVKLLLCHGPSITALRFDAQAAVEQLPSSVSDQGAAPSGASSVGLGRYLPSEARFVTSRTDSSGVILPGGPYVHSMDASSDGCDPWTHEAPLITAARRHCASELGLDLWGLSDSAFVKVLTIHSDNPAHSDASANAETDDCIKDVTVVYAVTGWLTHCAAVQRQAAGPPGLPQAEQHASSSERPVVTLYGRSYAEANSHSVRHQLMSLESLLERCAQDAIGTGGEETAMTGLCAEAVLEIMQCCSAAVLQHCVASIHAVSAAGLLPKLCADGADGRQSESAPDPIKRVRKESADSSSTSVSSSGSASAGYEAEAGGVQAGEADPDAQDAAPGVRISPQPPPSVEEEQPHRERSNSVDSLFEAPPAEGDDEGEVSKGMQAVGGAPALSAALSAHCAWLHCNLWHIIAAFRLLDKEGAGFTAAGHLQLLFLHALPGSCSLHRASSLVRRAFDVLSVGSAHQYHRDGPPGRPATQARTGTASGEARLEQAVDPAEPVYYGSLLRCVTVLPAA